MANKIDEVGDGCSPHPRWAQVRLLSILYYQSLTSDWALPLMMAVTTAFTLAAFIIPAYLGYGNLDTVANRTDASLLPSVALSSPDAFESAAADLANAGAVAFPYAPETGTLQASLGSAAFSRRPLATRPRRSKTLPASASRSAALRRAPSGRRRSGRTARARLPCPRRAACSTTARTRRLCPSRCTPSRARCSPVWAATARSRARPRCCLTWARRSRTCPSRTAPSSLQTSSPSSSSSSRSAPSRSLSSSGSSRRATTR